MRTFPAAVTNLLAAETQTWATCWRINLTRYPQRITGISKADPAVVTTLAEHGLTTGNVVHFVRMDGMTGFEDTYETVTVLTATTFSVAVDSSAFPDFIDGRAEKVLHFTDHDVDLVLDGFTYESSVGYSSSSVSSVAGGAVTQQQAEVILDNQGITEDDLRSGVYDYAEITVFRVDWEDTTTNYVWNRGTLGEVLQGDNRATAEFRGLTQALSSRIGDHYSVSCRVKELGDSECKVNLASYTFQGSVIAITDNRVFEVPDHGQPGGYFNYGEIYWKTGNNKGLDERIKRHELDAGTHRFYLEDSMYYDVQVGDTYQVIAGCNRNLDTCDVKFANTDNFRGEPFMIGLDRLVTGD